MCVLAEQLDGRTKKWCEETTNRYLYLIFIAVGGTISGLVFASCCLYARQKQRRRLRLADSQRVSQQMGTPMAPIVVPGSVVTGIPVARGTAAPVGVPQVALPVTTAIPVQDVSVQSMAMVVQVPGGIPPGGQFVVQTPSGPMLVTCPLHSKPGDDIQIPIASV